MPRWHSSDLPRSLRLELLFPIYPPSTYYPTTLLPSYDLLRCESHLKELLATNRTPERLARQEDIAE